MSMLVSPGVSVPVVDESFYIPASAPTVPLFFLATQANKMQPDGITAAPGTQEHNVVRTVTSIGQSTQLYGVPFFNKDGSGNEYHGDCRNEYGAMALNQFLGVGNRAYVVRANVDLADDAVDFLGIGTAVWDGVVNAVGVGDGEINGVIVPSEFVQPQTITVVMNSATTFTVSGSKFGVIGFGETDVAFSSSIVNFTLSAGLTAQKAEDYFEFDLIYTHTSFTPTAGATGRLINLRPDPALAAVSGSEETWTITFTSATAFEVSGSVTTVPSPATGTVGVAYDNGKINFTVEAGVTPFAATDEFTVDVALYHLFDPLGTTQDDKRISVITALQAVINSNADVRASDVYEYNLIVCPGYPEVIDELLALSVAIDDEAFVIADTPVNKTPEQTAAFATSSDRKNSTSVAYYYPWGLASNLDGRDVVCAPSGIALRTYAYSDNASYVWFAPAGPRRGLVTGISKVGYITGTIGTPTTFVEANLNKGQRDNLYEAFKNINPIVYFAGRGLLVFGQKTSAVATSALDRVNVMRGTMYLKRALRKGAFSFLFEPNDRITRDNLKAACDGILGDIFTKRGLYDFASLCDESNNTPFRIDNNELWCDVAVKWVKAAEFIYIPIRVLSTGAAMPS